MSGSSHVRVDPRLDLLLERTVAAPPERVWEAWTMPEQLVRWFAPAPFTTVGCEIELRPGGVFRTVLRSPGGAEHTTVGCYLEINENERLVWTTALGPGFRPAEPAPTPTFTAVITLAPAGPGTNYSALAMHADPEARRQHAARGFRDGWNQAHRQLATLFSARPATPPAINHPKDIP